MKIPQHIAIIMDGNGRWAKRKGLPKIEGHRRGADTAVNITKECAELGVGALTLYTFSSENWKRPKKEIDGLMKLFEKGLKKNAARMLKDNIVFRTIGRRDRLPESLRKVIEQVETDTANNSGIKLTLAVDYGGRQEIIDAVKKACVMQSEGSLETPNLDEEVFRGLLYAGDISDPDLIIRTSGEMRLSNFLLWQAAYSELYITETFWPDFDKDELKKAMEEFGKRDRRFGE
ncbi:MAG: isoprenyl transferase [Candidatus Aadella gelida]|nr:isoprenyl transferase [Candidatus Aadella gelida]